MNTFNITGRIVKEPELRYTKSNKPAVKLNIAINNTKEDVTFLPIKIFGKQAENISKYCSKGSLLAINGTIKNNNYQDKDGNMKYDYSFIGLSVEFLSSKTNSNIEPKTIKIEPKNEPYDNTQIYADFGDSIEISDEEICF